MNLCIKCGGLLPEGAWYCPSCGKKQQPEKRRPRCRPNGSGTAYRRGKTWTGVAAGYSYTEIGKDGALRLIRRRPTQGGFRTKTEALDWANTQAYQPKKEAPTLLALWQGWSENNMKTLSDSKQTAYRKARQRLEPIISRKIDSLALDDLQEVVNSEATSHYTARDMKSLLSHLYQRAMAGGGATGSITVNLARMIVLPELKEDEPEPFTAEEVSAVWKAWDGGDLFAGYILLMIYSSMMPGELLNCKADMINYDLHEIYGCGLKTKERKKESPIVFPDFIAPVLKTLAAASHSRAKKLYAHNKDIFYKKYHEFTARAGIRDLPPYSCRHTTATEAVKMGVELPVVKQIMRHAKLASTQRYIHVSTEAAHAGVNRLKRA